MAIMPALYCVSVRARSGTQSPEKVSRSTYRVCWWSIGSTRNVRSPRNRTGIFSVEGPGELPTRLDPDDRHRPIPFAGSLVDRELDITSDPKIAGGTTVVGFHSA